MKNLNSIGILMIATRDYHDLWKSGAKSIDQRAFLSCSEVRIHLFTDKPLEMASWAQSNLLRIDLVCYEIESFGWPEVTLYRYSIFTSHFAKIQEDFVM
jgi:hypothetical protein